MCPRCQCRCSKDRPACRSAPTSWANAPATASSLLMHAGYRKCFGDAHFHRRSAMHLTTLRASLGCALICSALGAAAQTYPDKPIRAIVPFAAGGGVDIATRSVGQKLTERWHQQVIVDNRGGANGNIGAEMASRAAPDDDTLLFGSTGPMAINPTL